MFGIENLVKDYLKSPDGQKTILGLLQSQEGMRCIKEVAQTEEGRRMIAQSILSFSQGLGVPDDKLDELAEMLRERI